MRNWLVLIALIVGVTLGGCKCQLSFLAKDKTAQVAEVTTKTPKKEVRLEPEREKKLLQLRDRISLTPLFVRWQHGLTQETIRKLYVVDDLLLVETAADKVFAFNRHSGVPQWVYTVNDPLDFPPTTHKDTLYLLSITRLHVIDKKSGELLRKKDLSFVPCSPIRATDEYLYMGSWDNFLYAVKRDTLYHDWRYRIDGHILAAPTFTDGYLFIPGSDHRVYALRAMSGTTLGEWGKEGRFTTRGANVVSIKASADSMALYVGSRDYNLYSINRINGDLRWKFESGGEITCAPWLFADLLYVISERKLGKDAVLYALDSETGVSKWSLEHAKQLLFRGNRYDWIVRYNNRIATVSYDSGTFRYEYDLSAMPIYATNTIDKMGYLATKDGFLFAVEEK